MKATSGPVYTALRQNFETQVVPILHADWNMNKFFETTCDNTPTEDSAGYDVELYPINSIAMPNRPTSGIIKGVVNQATVAPDNHDTNQSARYYVASKNDIYKYWQSQVTSASSPTSGSYALTNTQPYVTYQDKNGADTLVPCNKVSFTVENTYAGPVNYTVDIQSTIGGSWTTIATNTSVPTNGKVELWYDGSAWTTTPVYTVRTNKIHGVRMTVTSLNQASAYFNLIELAAHLEIDLTADVETVDDSFTMGDVDYTTPLGDLSSNTANITLMNDSDFYTNSNTNSILYGLLDHGVQLDLWYRYTVSGTTYDIKQFRMFSDVWQESIDTTTISCVDQSKFFQDINPPPVMYLNVSVQEAIWKICDAIGFNNYQVSYMPTKASSMIDVFWTTGDNTVWEVFQDLSKSVQCAIWFDENGVMQIKTRDVTFDDTQANAWTLRQQASGVELADIVTFSPVTDYEANKVTIDWQSTHFSEEVDNVTPMAVVWEPSGDYVLRSSALAKTLNVGDNYAWLAPKDASEWPWIGMFQVDGEWVSYTGKQYVYIDATSTRQTVTVKSLAEQQQYDATSPVHKQYLNHYNGALVITTRGLYNTDPQNHVVGSLSNWTKSLVNAYGTPSSPCNGITIDPSSSTVTIQSPNTKTLNDYRYLHRGGTVNQGWRRLGTRLRVDKSGHANKEGGIFFCADGSGSNLTAGYYVDILPTAKVHRSRNQRNEIYFYSMKSDGTKKAFGGDHIRIKDASQTNDKNAYHIKDTGSPHLILEGQFVDIDIYYTPGTDDDIQIWVDGKLMIDATVTGASGWKHSFIDRFGMFVRGNSSYTYEYMYGISRNDILYGDQESFYDRIHGGYRGYQWMTDYTYEIRNPGPKQKTQQTKQKVKYQQRFFDEFGPYIHEIDEVNVKFNTNGLPVQQSKLWMTNTQQAAVEDYWSSPSTGHFTIVNISRYNAIMQGADPLMSSANNPVNQSLMILGQPLIQDGAEQIIQTDQWAINRRGLNEVTYQSSWIQTQAEANNFASWLINHWARSDTSATTEIFGNSLIEIGDIVAVQYKEMTPTTHRFYVVGVTNSFDAGLTTTLTLRRVSI